MMTFSRYDVSHASMQTFANQHYMSRLMLVVLLLTAGQSRLMYEHVYCPVIGAVYLSIAQHSQ